MGGQNAPQGVSGGILPPARLKSMNLTRLGLPCESQGPLFIVTATFGLALFVALIPVYMLHARRHLRPREIAQFVVCLIAAACVDVFLVVGEHCLWAISFIAVQFFVTVIGAVCIANDDARVFCLCRDEWGAECPPDP